MIRDVMQAKIDLFKAMQKQEKSETRGGGNQDGDVESQEIKGDRVTLGAGENKAATYSKPVAAGQLITAKLSVLEMTVSTMFTDQGAVGAIGSGEEATANDAMAKLFQQLGLGTGIDVGDGKTVNLADLSQEDAQKLVAEDGYWGMEQTSDRIVNLAVSLVGGDSSKLDKIKESIMKGFDLAKEAFGGKLPDISQQTIDAAMKKLDQAMPQGDQKPVV